jgi:hypothetical protein
VNAADDRLNGKSLPMTGVVVMEDMGGGEGDDPEPDNEGSDRDDPSARRPIMGSEAGGFANAENLAADANGHQENAEDEGDPDHGPSFVPYLRWMREEAFEFGGE